MKEKNTRKIKILIILLVTSIIIIFTMGILKYRKYSDKQTADSEVIVINDKEKAEVYHDELSKENKKILIEKSSSLIEMGFTFSGKVIFNDGNIYSWNYSSSLMEYKKYNLNSADGLKNFILENGSLDNKKVPVEDLEKIENYINNLEDVIEINPSSTSMWTNKISVWNFEGNEIELKVQGTREGENKTENAQEIFKIIKKYF